MLQDVRANDTDLDALLDINQFTDEDLARLKKVGEIIVPQLPQLTDRFYDQLTNNSATAPFLEGRLEALKQTHFNWLKGLFTGVMDAAYVKTQWEIGRVHAKMHIAPLFVASSMSYLRSEMPKLITDDQAQQINENRDDIVASILKLLDISQFVIDRSYYDRLMEVTGISKALLHRLMS